MKVNRVLSDWIWNNPHIDDMQKAQILPRLRGKEETIAQLAADLEIEKQKHLDTSNWAEEQQDRADKAEAKNERLLKHQSACDAMLIECLDTESTRGSIMIVGRQVLEGKS